MAGGKKKEAGLSSAMKASRSIGRLAVVMGLIKGGTFLEKENLCSMPVCRPESPRTVKMSMQEGRGNHGTRGRGSRMQVEGSIRKEMACQAWQEEGVRAGSQRELQAAWLPADIQDPKLLAPNRHSPNGA